MERKTIEQKQSILEFYNQKPPNICKIRLILLSILHFVNEVIDIIFTL